MKRLYSYWTYPYVLFPLIADTFITYFLFHEYDISFRLFFLLLLINAIFIGGFIALGSDLKRVHLKDASLYVYDLYSNIPYITPLEQLRKFECDNLRHNLLLGIYIASFIVEDGSYYEVRFMKSKLIFDIRKYI